MVDRTAERNRGVLRDGLATAWPICLGYLPIGLVLGVLAQKAGFGPLETALMSTLVFAGESRALEQGRPELIAAFPTFAVALKTRSLGLTVVAGMFCCWLAGMILGRYGILLL